jgi:ubiquinone/menaquinone biosynthesis C-methylase UbiE
MTSFGADSESGAALDAHRNGLEVLTGLLKCSCGKAYPIIEGVPRLLEEGIGAFPDFLEAYKSQIGPDSLSQRTSARQQEDEYAYIRKSFSREWALFDYEGDNTWGWTLEERKRIFADDVALTKDELATRKLLDAGCGNGTLTAAVSPLVAEVIGIDLNDGLGKAHRNRARFADGDGRNVQYVQGNLFNPPLQPESFDLIYCSGVIHHTPSTKESFRKLVPLVKKGGRLYVWVYSKRNFVVRLFMDSGRQLKRVMSPQSLLTTCRIMAPLYKVGTDSLNWMGLVKFRKRNVREITLDLFDAFAPQFNHRHTEEEVQGWFREEGFTNISTSGRQKHGFGVYGDKT